MALWEAYGDPNIPPFLEDNISLVTSAMVPPTLDEITPPDSPVATTIPIPTIDASNSVQ